MSSRGPMSNRERRERERARQRERDWRDEVEGEEYDRREANPALRSAMIATLGFGALLLLIILARGFSLIGTPIGTRQTPTRELILGAPTAAPDPLLGGAAEDAASSVDPAAGVPPVGPPPGPPPPVSSTFEGFFFSRGGERILGRPIGPPQNVNGREIQWFERARVEHWPEHAGTPYEVQLGRLGVEFTQGREFARQSYFVSTSELRFFPETGHAVGGLFLRFWEQHGALDSFGLPISDEFDEVLADGLAYRVQYFERARLEYHPQHAGTPYEVQVGLLGTALMNNEARPNTVQPAPTQVPMP